MPAWNISPKPRRCTGTALRSVPSQRIRPEEEGSIPAIARSRVDLPQPEGPSRHSTEESATVRFTSDTPMVRP